jgi:hypothetical protein
MIRLNLNLFHEMFYKLLAFLGFVAAIYKFGTGDLEAAVLSLTAGLLARFHLRIDALEQDKQERDNDDDVGCMHQPFVRTDVSVEGTEDTSGQGPLKPA